MLKTLIGVIIGGVIGFGSTLLRDYIREKQQKKGFFKSVLSDLEHNKELVKKNTTLGYRTLDYIDAKGIQYLSNISEEFQTYIYDIQTKTSLLSNSAYNSSYILAKPQIIEALNNLLDKAIPQLKKYLKVK